MRIHEVNRSPRSNDLENPRYRFQRPDRLGSGPHFDALGWDVHGVDNNMRADFFGPQGDTRWNQQRLESTCKRFTHHELDIRDRPGVLRLIEELRPDAIVHAAAQPSHDLAASRPFDDFDVNAVGTLNLLEGVRRHVPDSPFVYMSTNKVYGDAPNELELKELDTRWEYARPEDYPGIREDFRIDRSKHSLFGASKVAADVMVAGIRPLFRHADLLPARRLPHRPQPFGRGAARLPQLPGEGERQRRALQGLRLQGEAGPRQYPLPRRGRFIERFIAAPRCGEVYNIGGGRDNSCSILEAFRAGRGHHRQEDELRVR